MHCYSYKEITDLSLGKLSVESSPLTKWPGALIWGSSAPIATAEPEAIQEKDVTDFQYRKKLEEVPDDRPNPAPVPDESAVTLRDSLIKPAQRDSVPIPDSFARPNATAFDQLQWQAKIDYIPNRILDELKLKTFDRNFQETPTCTIEHQVSGARWVFNELQHNID
jgi:hypothetical protein